jgi:hypothetical protein
MIKRKLELKTKNLAEKFPVVSITGPRQSGKTTLAKKCFPKYKYYNLEDPNTRTLIEDDPKKFVNPGNTKIIFDEVQKLPELLSYIQVAVDETNKPGQYIISGSQNLLLSEKVSQSLAGRVAIINLLPFSIEELKKEELLESNAYKQILKGFYPRIYDQKIPVRDFYSGYLATYIERDVRQIKNIGDISTFQRFMQLLAGRTGQLFNASAISNDLSIDSKTATSWLNVLEASYITYRLPPYFKNFGKRLTKSSKVYFYDTGLLSYLLGIDNIKEMDTHFARGSLFENLVISEVKKHIINNSYNIRTYFWRDSNVNEIDLLLDKGSKIDAIEIKSAQGYNSRYTKGLEYWDNIENTPDGDKFIIYNGDEESHVKNFKLINWKNISSNLIS